MINRSHPAALAHGELREVLPNVFFVTGTLRMPGPVPVTFSRNMTVVREGARLIIVNSVRLDEAGLRSLDALGKVTDVIRIAGYHGMDDPFYKERYGAKVWVVKGQRYVAGFNAAAPETYLTPDVEIDGACALPLANARIYRIESNAPEGLLLLEREGGVLISGDCLQNWQTTDAYFSLAGKLMMKAMGFIKPHNVGPAWMKQAKPPTADLLGILDLDFAHVLPAHGSAVISGAKANYRPRLEAIPNRS
jgi:hypothetical protein